MADQATREARWAEFSPWPTKRCSSQGTARMPRAPTVESPPAHRSRASPQPRATRRTFPDVVLASINHKRKPAQRKAKQKKHDKQNPSPAGNFLVNHRRPLIPAERTRKCKRSRRPRCGVLRRLGPLRLLLRRRRLINGRRCRLALRNTRAARRAESHVLRQPHSTFLTDQCPSSSANGRAEPSRVFPRAASPQSPYRPRGQAGGPHPRRATPDLQAPRNISSCVAIRSASEMKVQAGARSIVASTAT